MGQNGGKPEMTAQSNSDRGADESVLYRKRVKENCSPADHAEKQTTRGQFHDRSVMSPLKRARSRERLNKRRFHQDPPWRFNRPEPRPRYIERKNNKTAPDVIDNPDQKTGHRVIPS